MPAVPELFGEGKRVVWAGSLFVVAFCGFPWGFVVYGQLLSNMVSFMLIPLAFIALVGAIEAKGLSVRSGSRSSWRRVSFP